MSDLFIEILSEEVPARMQRQALAQFTAALEAKLKDAGLCDAKASDSFVTPRRMAVRFAEVAIKQPDRQEEKRGPRVGSPQQAIDGFLKASGLASLDQAERRALPNGEFWFAVTAQKGRPATVVLPGLIMEAMRAIAWPKSMRWATSKASWVRPLHGIVAQFGGQTLEGEFDLGEGVSVPFSNQTQGHRFLAPEPITVTDWAGYRKALAEAHVTLDQEERRAAILKGAKELAASVGLTPRADAGLIEEIVGLVECPVPLMGRIDDAFMDLPAEVLTTSMRVNQRYIALERPDGSLAPQFVTIANLPTPDGGKVIVAGNERVLRARLSDARFFWDLDRQTRLETFAEKLDQRIFHAKLGTVSERVARLRALAREIAPLVGADSDQAERAAALAKADLSSGMVGEFPELQGLMGRYYARHQGEPAAVADAIAEHYAPLGPSDRAPTQPVSVAVALADKLDMLAGFFSIDEKPTGSRDPYALRRAALGVLRIVLESDEIIPVRRVLQKAVELQPGAFENAKVEKEILGFLIDRVKVLWRDQGLRHDVINAVFSDKNAEMQQGNFKTVRDLAQSIASVLETEEGKAVISGYRRAANLYNAEIKKVKETCRYSADLLKEPAEIDLDQGLTKAQSALVVSLEKMDYRSALIELGALRQPVDRFLVDVTVNVPEQDLRLNRLALLGRIVATFDTVADFSAIEG